MRSRVASLAVLLPLTVLALTGCQSQVDKYVKTDAATIDQNMRDAVSALTSVHVHSTLNDSNGASTLDVSTDSSGHCVATVTLGNQTLNLIFTDPNTVYAKGNADFWSQYGNVSTQSASLLASQWVTGVPASKFSGLCDLKQIVAPLSANSIAQDSPKVLGKATVEGKDAVNIQVTSATGTQTIAVAASSPHYPLSVASSDNKRAELLSDFNATVTAVAPTDAINLSQIVPSK